MKTFIEAINEAIHEEMERDENVFVVGEDVGVRGGVFRATQGLIENMERIVSSTHRSLRVRLPESESGLPCTACDRSQKCNSQTLSCQQ